MITVACVWVRGNVPYSLEYVMNLRRMVKRHLARPHRFMCLTDRRWAISKHVESIRVPWPRGMYGWWSKIELFKPGRFMGRVLYLDLDTLVVGALDAVVDYPSPFALLPHAGTFTGTYHGKTRRVVPRFNSSVMVWDAGVNDALFTEWRPEVTKDLHGDQDWYGQQMPQADTLPAAWFPRLSELDGPPPSEAKVVLCKVPKNAVAARRLPWVDAAWRAA
jgi:hypothetical protein